MTMDITMNDAANAIRTILNPKSVVFYGASSDPEKGSNRVVHYMDNAGFAGKTYVVNLKGGEIAGRQAHKRVSEIGEPVDLAYVTVPSTKVPDALRELGQAGTKCAVLPVGGFAEIGTEEGRRLASELEEIAGQYGMHFVGPVCNGIYSPSIGLALGSNTMHRRKLAPGRIALVSQSGALVGPFLSLIEANGGGFSRFVSSGAELNLKLSDYLGYLAEDDQTDVIALLAEHVGNGDDFRRFAQLAQQNGKSVVALKIGNSELGRAATIAHSANLSGSRQIYDSVFEDLGIRVLPTVETLAVTATILARGRQRPSGGVIGCSTSGGGAILLADLMDDAGVAAPTLAPETVSAISSRMRFGAGTVMNPFDLGLGGEARYNDNFLALAADPSCAILLCYGTPMADLAKRERLLGSVEKVVAAHPNLPVIYLSPAQLYLDEIEALARCGVPHCTSSLDAAAIARALLPVRPARAISGNTPTTELGLIQHLHGPLSEYQGKQVLKALGVELPIESLARSAEEAAELAEKIGYPVVLKASGPNLFHKSELGLVELNIVDAQSCAAACTRILERAASHPDITLEGVLVSRMLKGGTEAIVGFVRDPEFGPIAIIGPGGIFAELFGSASMTHLPLPLDRSRVADAIGKGALGQMLTGFRADAAFDKQALVDLVCGLGTAVTALGSRFEALDINPVIVLPVGQGAHAVDALMVLDH